MESQELYEVRIVSDLEIPVRDGIKLAATIYLPVRPGRYPGIFSFYPYLKDGWIGIDHAAHHRYFASRGYAVMQVDFRGTGASEGRNPHPFDLQERLDGYDVVEWIAKQDWCTGEVGVWGISYGGITSLSIASTRPPHLRAIIPIHATFDNYEWLLRTHGSRGLLLADADWGSRMAACNLLPPVISDPSGQWAVKWRERLSDSSPWFMDWHGKPPDEEFWKRRRIPLSDIKVPTFAICGWYDAYTAPAFRIFEQVDAPARVLIGPWKHALPDLAPYSPIGGLQEMTRWWDRWLKGIDNGVDKEPPVCIFVQGEGKWRFEEEWPIARTHLRRQHFSSCGSLLDKASLREDTVGYDYDSRVGLGSTGLNGHRLHIGIPIDQSADDYASVSFTSEPLVEDTEITGEPVAHITISADVKELTLVVKLCIVDEVGRSRVISRGNANPARIDAHAEVNALRVGERRCVLLKMHPTSIVAKAGMRLRVCVAGADFPELWPTPLPYRMTLHLGGEESSYIDLPIVPTIEERGEKPVFGPARVDVAPPDSGGSTKEQYDSVRHYLDRRVAEFETRIASQHRLADGSILKGSHWAKVATDADKPSTTILRTDTCYEILRPLAAVTVRVTTVITPYRVEAKAQADLDGQSFWSRSWSKETDDWNSSL